MACNLGYGLGIPGRGRARYCTYWLDYGLLSKRKSSEFASGRTGQ